MNDKIRRLDLKSIPFAVVLLLSFVLLINTANAASTSNTTISNTNLIIEGLPPNVNLTLSLTRDWYTINGATGTTNYVINFTTQNGNTIVTIPSSIKPYGFNYLSYSLPMSVDLSGNIWACIVHQVLICLDS